MSVLCNLLKIIKTVQYAQNIIRCNINFKRKYYIYWEKKDTYIILCCLVKSLNYVVYKYILIKKVKNQKEH